MVRGLMFVKERVLSIKNRFFAYDTNGRRSGRASFGCFNEGYISKDEMIDILSCRGDVFVFEKEYKRYVGAQIGIHNPQGNRVGEAVTWKTRNIFYGFIKELIYPTLLFLNCHELFFFPFLLCFVDLQF